MRQSSHQALYAPAVNVALRRCGPSAARKRRACESPRRGSIIAFRLTGRRTAEKTHNRPERAAFPPEPDPTKRSHYQRASEQNEKDNCDKIVSAATSFRCSTRCGCHHRLVPINSGRGIAPTLRNEVGMIRHKLAQTSIVIPRGGFQVTVGNQAEGCRLGSPRCHDDSNSDEILDGCRQASGV